MKTGTRQAVIGIRISEPRFKLVNGTSMDHVQQVHCNLHLYFYSFGFTSQIIGIIGGISKQSTRKFLSDSEEVTEEEPKITEDNIAQYNALLWPLKEVDSSLIIRFCNRMY